MFQFMGRYPGFSYLIGLAIMLGGIGLGAATFAAMPDKDGYFPPYLVPGTHQMELKRGVYEVYYETQSLINGRPFGRLSLPPHLEVTFTDNNGRALNYTLTDDRDSFDIGHRRGNIHGRLEVPRSGTYQLQAGWADGSNHVLVLAVKVGDMGKDMGQALGLIILVGLCGGGLWLATTKWATYRFGNAEAA